MVPSVLFIAALAYSPIHLNVRRLDESAVSAKSMHLPLEELETTLKAGLYESISMKSSEEGGRLTVYYWQWDYIHSKSGCFEKYL
jgi:hypothetical protein